jgi:integrase
VQGIQPLLPQGPVPAQPFIDLGERLGAKTADPPLRLLAGLDEPRLTQYPQVPRYPRTGDRLQRRQLTHGGRAAGQRFQHGPPALVRQCPQSSFTPGPSLARLVRLRCKPSIVPTWARSGRAPTWVFTTRTGRPIEPRNCVRSFRRICDDNQIRVIKVHHSRHTVGSLLKDLKVPARDAEVIIGHTRISTTLEIYTNVDDEAKREALTRLHGLLDHGEG